MMMDHEFWHERWSTGQIAFHQTQVNELLTSIWPRLGLANGDLVLVPLCGKSLDMLWLRAQGLDVVGVELSEEAVTAFFDENKIPHDISDRDGFKVFSADCLTIMCGDFFALPVAVLQTARGVYDRGAVIALPPEMRQRYTAKLKSDLHASARVLIVCVEYDQSEMSGPPFSVSHDEIAAYYEDRFN
ncbi:MAG: thiopurine S-methyltransferase, partial [Hyphomicrobiaceae bacterium]